MTSLAERILFEDNHLLIVNKLPSEIVQGDKTGDVPLLEKVKQYIGGKYNKPGAVFAGLVHRIDRPVSGAVVFARTSKALSRMTEKLKSRDFDKTYLAIVRNAPQSKEALLEHYLAKNEQQNKSYIVNEGSPNAKLARLSYKQIAHSDSFILLEINLLTGRHHQIRAQLAAIGCPFLGDLKYGDRRSLPDGSIALHAVRLDFDHPVGDKPMSVNAEPNWNSRHWEIFMDTILKTYFPIS
ncbi:MAG TPA: RNA pseudouridine synthase [Bacteroidales bacterium]|nr:RNA pseudouridine synthase [Bacteroidales bacterium]